MEGGAGPLPGTTMEKGEDLCPLAQTGSSQSFALTVSLLLAGCSPGSGQAGCQGSGCLPPWGLLTRAGVTSGFWDLCQDLLDRWPEPRSTCRSLRDPTHLSGTCSKPGWSRVMGWVKGMGLGQTPGKLRWLGATLPGSGPGNTGPGNTGCEPWGLQPPTPRCGALGSGVFMAEAGAPALDPACGPSLPFLSPTPHSKGRALSSANATGLFVVEAATHPGRFHVLVVNL